MDFGKREDGSAKGNGFFGVLKRPDGKVSTELSVDMDFGEGKESFPLLVPTLNKKEIDHLLSGEKPTNDIYNKAIDFYQARKRAGLPAFASPEEEASFKVPEQ